MRQIKFRGKRLDNGEWVEGDLIQGQGTKAGRMYILPHAAVYPPGCHKIYGWNVDPATVGQFTGLTDKNGKEIFEGDVLNYKSHHPKHDGKHFKNAVEFAKGQSLCGWRMRNKSTIVKATPFKFSSSEVIGNAIDNKELLTK